ncbi:MAG: hypothetical protein ABUL72_03565 [Armatimonadota bacterium]
MALQRVTPTTPLILRSRRSVEHFKVCTLCGALNIKENDECFVCRWSGEFDMDGLTVRVKINEIVRECPELLEVVRRVNKPKPLERLSSWWGRVVYRIKYRGNRRPRLDTHV